MAITQWKVKSIFKEMFPLLVILTFVGIFSGILLEFFEKTLLKYPQLLVLIPVMIGVGGNLGAIFGARISTGLHLGIIKLTPKNKALRQNIIAIIILSIILFSVLGIITNPISKIIGIKTNLSITTSYFISISSGLILSILIVIITIISSYLTYQFGMDPDNTILPIITSVCDMLGIIVFYFAVKFFI